METFIPTLTPEQQNATIMSFENMPDPLGKKPKGATVQEVNYLNKLFASQQRIAMIGRQPVTVVNINPFQLMVNGPLFSDLRVAPNKAGQEYSALVIRDVKFDVDQGLDRNHTPVEFWPVQLAKEFETQYADKGGVFFINGDLETNPELGHTQEFKAKYRSADGQLVAYCKRLKLNADNEWNTPNRSGARNIHPPHRIAAKILFDRKLLSKLPEWMEGDIAPEDVTDDCRSCKSATKKGQLLCTCGYVLDPFGAFQEGVIDEFNVSLERLTRAQVEAIGVSAFVAETVDERQERLKAGKRKPLSKFELQQQAALDAETRPQPVSQPAPQQQDKPKADTQDKNKGQGKA